MEIGSEEVIDLMEIEWVVCVLFFKALKKALPHLLDIFTPIQLINLFVSILLEKSIVFVGRQTHLVTCAILVFHRQMIKPLKWIHPLVSSLPGENFDLLDSPVPLIAGIIKVGRLLSIYSFFS